MQAQHIGPILFREECVFRKEIKFGDDISINLKLDKCTKNFSRWTMKHEIWKNGEILCAIITIDGAWLDTELRKLTVPGSLIAATFDTAPKTDGFILQDSKSK
jgi:acyl-CoA thioester hydrolase